MDKHRVLILEDDPKRVKAFVDVLQRLGWEWDHTDNVESAKSFIDCHMAGDLYYDEIWLDHDLGGEESQMAASDVGTGYEVAKHLAERIPEDDHVSLPVIVHSYNVPGAMNMLAVLGPRARYIPFNILMGYLEKMVERK